MVTYVTAAKCVGVGGLASRAAMADCRQCATEARDCQERIRKSPHNLAVLLTYPSSLNFICTLRDHTRMTCTLWHLCLQPLAPNFIVLETLSFSLLPGDVSSVSDSSPTPPDPLYQ